MRNRMGATWLSSQVLMVLAMMIGSANVSAVQVQIQGSGNVQPTVPSPLSGMDVDQSPPMFSSKTIPTDQFVNHVVDLREVLTGYSQDNQCSMNEAFSMLVKRLSLVQLDPGVDGKKMKNAIYQVLEQDKVSITARQSFFNDLQANLDQFRFGSREILIEVSFVDVPTGDVPTLQSFMIPGSFETFGNQLPQITPAATYATQPHSISKTAVANQVGDVKSGGTVVLATATKTKAIPAFVGRLDSAGRAQLLKFSRSRSGIEITRAPTMAIYPGTRGVVMDGAQRPFVVSLKKVNVGEFVRHQPVIQLLEDGVKLSIRGEDVDGKLQLHGDLAFSKVTNVESFDYPIAKNPEGRGYTIQIPEHQVRNIHWSALMESGNTLLIDPVEISTKEVQAKTRFKPAVNETMRRMVLIRPVLVSSEKADVQR